MTIPDNVQIDKMKICSKCYKVYGIFKYRCRYKVFYQKCRFDCEDYNRKSDMPPKEIEQERWEGFDFNEIVMLCYCCGQELLKSGSKWTVFFCEDCKKKVMELNRQFQRAIIPIGNHSLMSGIGLNKDGINNPEAVKEFHAKFYKMVASNEKIRKWNIQRLTNNFKLFGYDGDVLLDGYLLKVLVTMDKSEAFGQMCDFLLGIPRL